VFIRSSTAINDCLIALDTIGFVKKEDFDSNFKACNGIGFYFKVETNGKFAVFQYKSQEARDKAYDELCAFLNTNYKLRDFT